MAQAPRTASTQHGQPHRARLVSTVPQPLHSMVPPVSGRSITPTMVPSAASAPWPIMPPHSPPMASPRADSRSHPTTSPPTARWSSTSPVTSGLQATVPVPTTSPRSSVPQSPFTSPSQSVSRTVASRPSPNPQHIPAKRSPESISPGFVVLRPSTYLRRIRTTGPPG